MKTYQEIRAEMKSARALELLKEALSHLEGVECPERQGAEEERSREGRRVAPGEAKAVRDAIRALKQEAAECRTVADMVGGDAMGRKEASEWRKKAARLADIAVRLRSLLP